MPQNPFQSPASEEGCLPPETEPAKRRWNAERSYRFGVLPLAAFLFLGGVTFVLTSLLSSGNALTLPPIEAPRLKRLAFGTLGACLSLLGIAFYRLSPLARPGLYAYLALGFLVHLWLGLFDADYGLWFGALGAILALALAVGIHLAVRPAFAKGGEH